MGQVTDSALLRPGVEDIAYVIGNSSRARRCHAVALQTFLAGTWIFSLVAGCGIFKSLNFVRHWLSHSLL